MTDKAHRWSPEDDQFLRDNYQSMTDTELGRLIGRIGQAVRNRRKILQLERPEAEKPDSKPCSMCGKVLPIADFDNSHKKTRRTRTLSACRPCRNKRRADQRRAETLARRLESPVDPRNVWTDEELQFIRDNHETMTDAQMGERLGRSAVGVGKKRCAMDLKQCKVNLSGPKKWNKEETQELAEKSETMSIETLSDHFGVSDHSIRLKLTKMGLYKGQIAALKPNRQKQLDDDIELIRQETIYLINNMKDIDDKTVRECELRLDALVLENDSRWWKQRVDWKLGQFIELILPGYVFVPVIW